MPQQSFNVLSQQDEEETKGPSSLSSSTTTTNNKEEEQSHQNDVENANRCWLKIQIFITGAAILILLSFIIKHISTRREKNTTVADKDIVSSSSSLSWPPPRPPIVLPAQLYKDNNIYNTNNEQKEAVKFMFTLEPNKTYKQFSKMKTISPKYDFGVENHFAESLHITIDAKVEMKGRIDEQFPDRLYTGNYYGGYKIAFTFDQIDVETEQDTNDGYSSTYYSSSTSLAKKKKEGRWDNDFNKVLQSMVKNTTYINVDHSFNLLNKNNIENALHELDQNYSKGTLGGLSAVDQVTQITNLFHFLPGNLSQAYLPGDSWKLFFEAKYLSLGRTNDKLDFEGRSTFDGYLMYNENECAVISSWAYLSRSVITDDDDDLDNEDILLIKNGRIGSTLYWDVQNNIPRFALMTIEMTTEVQATIDDKEEGSFHQRDGYDDAIPMIEVAMIEVHEMYFAPAAV